MPLFRKNQPDRTPPDLVPSAHDDDSADEFNVPEMLDLLFDILGTRVGKDVAADMRSDFDLHVSSNPVTGRDEAYMCLVNKLINAVDQINDNLNRIEGRWLPPMQPASGDIAKFTFFGKS